MDKKKLGKLGEDIACKALVNQGHTILKKNYSLSIGEIDIISKKDQTLFFCEVKTRSDHTFGKGYEAVSMRKINTIRKVAEKFIIDQNWMGNVQLLVISITYRSETQTECEFLELY